ncbi:MAG: twin transmembrane helix small protein [Xanthomonadales bacterium]|nr:twin transmembrane helix small protein [Xanthomonadales bacterium]NIN60497.1 twin transmembrane helix small protein [Xanthomonadales bacterium]NIN75852.1 twin transmembrane helix small protein [Xanthomonadales bacterium]NIO15242.1 twin transmembrane helix small protein [Xanthomonadales bacterium]NIP12890.1 twin transmembrane helix small protein [Xanthomonadales bacterium]
MLPRAVIILFLLAIAYTLGSAFYYLIRDKGRGSRAVRQLSWRIGLSMLLFLMLYGAFLLGWLKPGSAGPIGHARPAAAAPAPDP